MARQVGDVVVGHGGDVQPGDPYVAAGGPVEGPHQLQQGGLARPRRADDPDQLPLADGEVHPAQGLDGRLAGVALGHVVDVEHRNLPRQYRAVAGQRPWRAMGGRVSVMWLGTTTSLAGGQVRAGDLYQPVGVVEQSERDRPRDGRSRLRRRPRRRSHRRTGPAARSRAPPVRWARWRW